MINRAALLASPRLLLRRAHVDDLDAIHKIMADERTMRFWSTPPHSTREQTRLWLESMILADPALSDDFIVEHGGEVIGKLGAWNCPRSVSSSAAIEPARALRPKRSIVSCAISHREKCLF